MPENEFKHTIFVPVGTSLIAKAKEVYSDSVSRLENDINNFFKGCIAGSHQNIEDIREIKWQKWCNCFAKETHPIEFFKRYYDEVCPDTEINRRRSGELDEQNPDKLTAEMASLYLFYEEKKQESVSSKQAGSTDLKDEVILLASDTDQGLYCACFLADYLRQKKPYKDQIGKVHVERIVKLEGGDSKAFEKEGLGNLITQTTTLIKERPGERQCYLNVTGGYKGVVPYLVLLGLAFGRMDIFYLFELSSQIIWLPKLPVGFDLLTWRDYRAFIHSIPHIEELEKEDLKALIPDTMRTLVEREKVKNKFPLTALGKVLREQYDEAHGREISEYGRGYLLTDRIKNHQKQQALKDCIDRWQYLWLGDLIPETVEHARGHTQRDLELLAQIINPILIKEPDFFGNDERTTDDSLLVLLSSIWLHDLGHSGSHLKCENKDGRINDGEQIERDVKGFPSLVRDIHHLLSWYLIGKDKDELFKSKCNKKWDRNKSIFDENLIEVIRQVCLYHRGRMPGSDGQKAYEHIGIKITEPLEKLTDNRVNLPLLGALLRIADAGDVQQERTISEEYEAMRALQNEREIESLKKEEERFREIVQTVFKRDSELSLPDYLRFTMKIAQKYFNKENANAFGLNNDYQKFAMVSQESKKYKELEALQTDGAQKYKDTYLDYLVDGCVQKFIEAEPIDGIDKQSRLFLRNWLSALNQIVFKKRPPAHFAKHRGIRAIMYLLERTDKTKDNKNKYYFKVLAIYRKGENEKDTHDLIENVKGVLREEIKGEYEKVKKILNHNRIYFDSFARMEEGTETMWKVCSRSVDSQDNIHTKADSRDTKV